MGITANALSIWVELLRTFSNSRIFKTEYGSELKLYLFGAVYVNNPVKICFGNPLVAYNML